MALGSGGQHPAVLEVAVRQALMQVPELEQQTSIPRSSVQSINLNHKDRNRLAFHLASGWSGQRPYWSHLCVSTSPLAVLLFITWGVFLTRALHLVH